MVLEIVLLVQATQGVVLRSVRSQELLGRQKRGENEPPAPAQVLHPHVAAGVAQARLGGRRRAMVTQIVTLSRQWTAFGAKIVALLR